MEKHDIERIFDNFKDNLTSNGVARVFEDGSKLKTEYLREPSKPEQATIDHIIQEVLELADISGKVGERKFELIRFDEEKGVKKRNRWVDIKGETADGRKFLLAAKKLNEDLEKEGKEGAVDQIANLFESNKKVYENYDFGIATDGKRWVFIDRSGFKAASLDIENDFRKIRKYILGEKRVVSEELEEEITDKFYDWYDALLHGGSYRDHKGSKKKIASEDCLVENISGLEKEDERKRYSQTLMNRLIFVKFLVTKNVIRSDILKYISDQPQDVLSEKLDKLFFNVLNKPEEERVNLDEEFSDIPYLNGSLFNKSEIEKSNPYIQVEAGILRKIIEFLDSFNFEGTEDRGKSNALDPEILGFIFERAMNDAERKKSGAYYTPREITEYLAQENIHPLVIERANKVLEEKGYKEEERLENIDDLFSKPNPPTIKTIMIEVVAELKICDNACGSGAFLLSAADVIYDLWVRAVESGAIDFNESQIKKLIIRDNLYGADINPNAVEIAKLRMWLWVADSYDHESAEPLPNIDYNILQGNTLLGYTDVKELLNETDLSEYGLTRNAIKTQLKQRNRLLEEYKAAKGKDARELADEIDKLGENLNTLLDNKLIAELEHIDGFDQEKFQNRDPLHWGIEFYEVFDEEDSDKRGFDVIVGNPPYIGFKDAKKFERRIFEEEFSEIYNGKNDYLYYFIDRSIDLLSDNARLGYIISRYFLEADYADRLRDKLKKDTQINYIIDFYGVNTIFPELGIHPLILGFSKSDSEDNRFNSARVAYEAEDLPVREMLNRVFDALNNWEDNYLVEYNRVEQKRLENDCWILADPEEMKRIENIRAQSRPLGGESGICNINQGVITAADKVNGWKIKDIDRNDVEKGDGIFVLSHDELEGMGVSPSHEIIRRWCKNSDIDRWNIESNSKEFLIYAHEEFSLEKYPEFKKHFNKMKGGLKGRSSKAYGWQRLHRPRDPDIFDNRKIVTPYKAPENKFAYDENKFTFSADIYSLTLKPELGERFNLKFILGILNSTLGEYLVFRQAKRLGYQYEYYPYLLNRIPIYNSFSEEEKEEIVSLVDKILSSGCNEKLKKELDELVYNLYSISETQVMEDIVDRYKVNEKT